jgi:large subunit ribosomal protein L24
MKRPTSSNPSKQRKFLYTAPLHIRRSMIAGHLSKELRQKYGRRSFTLRKGDEVEVMRGKFKKKTGRVSRINTKKYKVYIDGVMVKKTDGTERQAPVYPSNLKITKLDVTDKRRLKVLEKSAKGAKK